jgi:glycosyltransferase involved in cell wall biosynthesis
VANLRAQKDHLTLIRAMASVISQVSDAHLLLVGAPTEEDYARLVRDEITCQRIDRHVSVLGERDDIFAILKSCDIGVLSSASEGLPLALLEYGLARLAVVATAVGQCADVLDHGRVGILVPPESPNELAAAMVSLLRSVERRAQMGLELQQRIQRYFSRESAVRGISQVYQSALKTENRVL